MQIKNTLMLVRIATIKRQEMTGVGEDVQKKEPVCFTDGNVNLCSHYGKQYGESPEN